MNLILVNDGYGGLTISDLTDELIIYNTIYSAYNLYPSSDKDIKLVFEKFENLIVYSTFYVMEVGKEPVLIEANSTDEFIVKLEAYKNEYYLLVKFVIGNKRNYYKAEFYPIDEVVYRKELNNYIRKKTIDTFLKDN